MEYQTLYRKYRPKKFEFVYGQDGVVRTLQNTIINQRISHAYLFTGPRGTGKTSCAKLFAKAINCLNNQKGDACNECENCKAFNLNNNPDIIEIDAASNNGVDEIREIKNKVNLVPSISKYKVYIIDEVHMLSIGAFNALLKTLEEPPKYVVFILATTEPQKLPNTVISRCQRYDFKSICEAEMKKCLMNICKLENINITESALTEIVNNSNGGMRDAIGLLDQSCTYSNAEITSKDVQILSGNISNEEILSVFNNILKYDYCTLINKIRQIDSLGKDFVLIAQKMLRFLHAGLIAKKTKNFDGLTDDEKAFFEERSDTTLYVLVELLNETIAELKQNYQKELIFEIKTIQMIDKIQEISNVPCETLSKDDQKKEKDNVKIQQSDEPKKNEEKELFSEFDKKIEELKKIRINNILKMSTKKELEYIKSLWKNIEEFLIDEKNKVSAGILLEGKPIAASSDGIIITLPVESLLKKVEKQYDLSKNIIKKIYQHEYKVVYVTEEFWKINRPDFVEKVRKNELILMDETKTLQEIKKIIENKSVSEFDDLIEMEEK